MVKCVVRENPKKTNIFHVKKDDIKGQIVLKHSRMYNTMVIKTFYVAERAASNKPGISLIKIFM